MGVPSAECGSRFCHVESSSWMPRDNNAFFVLDRAEPDWRACISAACCSLQLHTDYNHSNQHRNGPRPALHIHTTTIMNMPAVARRGATSSSPRLPRRAQHTAAAHKRAQRPTGALARKATPRHRRERTQRGPGPPGTSLGCERRNARAAVGSGTRARREWFARVYASRHCQTAPFKSRLVRDRIRSCWWADEKPCTTKDCKCRRPSHAHPSTHSGHPST